MINVNSRIQIPDGELEFTFVRSSGPGGQNVNKVNSKAVMRWQAARSPSLPDDVRARFLSKFASRLTGDGEIVISSQRYRDQAKNIADCSDKLKAMLLEVAVAPRKRRPTKPTRGSIARRIEGKRQTAEKKNSRRSMRPND